MGTLRSSGGRVSCRDVQRASVRLQGGPTRGPPRPRESQRGAWSSFSWPELPCWPVDHGGLRTSSPQRGVVEGREGRAPPGGRRPAPERPLVLSCTGLGGRPGAWTQARGAFTELWARGSHWSPAPSRWMGWVGAGPGLWVEAMDAASRPPETTSVGPSTRPFLQLPECRARGRYPKAPGGRAVAGRILTPQRPPGSVCSE